MSGKEKKRLHVYEGCPVCGKREPEQDKHHVTKCCGVMAQFDIESTK